MAVESVIATIGNESEELSEASTNTYFGELNAPSESGYYSVSVTAYDDSGNVSVANSEIVNVSNSLWITPKTDWKPTDRFNFVDYNRIKNNLSYLHERANQLWRTFQMEDMGENILSYEVLWNFERFNQFERNLEIINQNMLKKDYGYIQVFIGNGKFITYDELNRIESACLDMYDILNRQEIGIRKLSFALGRFKEVKI